MRIKHGISITNLVRLSQGEQPYDLSAPLESKFATEKVVKSINWVHLFNSWLGLFSKFTICAGSITREKESPLQAHSKEEPYDCRHAGKHSRMLILHWQT